MKSLYLDLHSGISGDMFIGAMLDLGVSLEVLEGELRKLGVGGYKLEMSRGQRGQMAGVKFDVHLPGEGNVEQVVGRRAAPTEAASYNMMGFP